MIKPKDKEALTQFMPEVATDYVLGFIYKYKVQFKIKNPRNTKLGDFRPAYKLEPYRISINGDLNEYEFLIVTLHEIAHLLIWDKFENRVKPHGKEWKEKFRELLYKSLDMNFFPDDIKLAIYNNYIKKATFTSTTSIELKTALNRYSDKDENTICLQDIPNNCVFMLKSGKTFKKEEKLRKRYRCKELKSGKYYTVHYLAEVIQYKEI